MKAKDLTGQRFGRLTVLSLSPDPLIHRNGKKSRQWLCRCDCDKELLVTTSALTAAKGTRSCGCKQKDAAKSQAINMEGQRFGRLIVLHRAPLEKAMANGQKYGWLCRCDCGREVIRSRKDLLSGQVRSCGCLLAETGRRKIVEQNVLGHYQKTTLSAIREDRPPNRNTTTGVKGVSWLAKEQRYKATIGLGGKSIYLGRFDRLEDAEKARLAAEEEYYGELRKIKYGKKPAPEE